MNYPPLLMNVRVRDRENGFRLFLPLPLFLLLPIALVVFIILSPLILVAAIVTWPSGWGKAGLQALWAACCAYCAMRGLKVDIRGPQTLVKVTVI